MQTEKTPAGEQDTLVKNIVDLIEEGNAHVSLDDALKNIPFSLLGERPGKLPYSIWQLVEHVRIAQWDLLEFSRNAKYVSPKWPDDYWPKEAAPKSVEDWKQCVKQISVDRKSFIELIQDAGENLYKPFEHGSGQSLLKEAFVLADHNSYHTGEIIVIRKLLNAWK